MKDTYMKTIAVNTLTSLISFRGDTTKIRPFYRLLLLVLSLNLFWATPLQAGRPGGGGGGKQTAPAAPSSLSASPMSSSQIDLHWQDNSLNESGFVVQSTLNPAGQWT